MKRIILVILICVCYNNFSYANNNSKTTSIRALNCFNDLKINDVEIIHMPSHILTRTAVTSEQLKINYIYKIDIIDLHDTINDVGIVNTLNSIIAENTNFTGDLRWGVMIFQDKKLSCSIYFNSNAEYGEINNKKYHFKKNDILQWFEVNFKFIMEND